MKLTAWPEQKEIEKLVRAGFATLDVDSTHWWADYVEDHPDTAAHFMYRWTDAGKVACFRAANGTPMGWAKEMHNGTVRHCTVCGRDLYHKPVGAALLKGPKALRNRCICLSCHAKGITLKQVGVEG